MLIEQQQPAINSGQELDKPIMTISAHSIQGKRNHMEDFFDIGYQRKHRDQRRPNEWPYEYFYFGIFDGHGGREAASFAKKNLIKFITEQKDFWSQDDEDVMRAIRTGFARTHSAMKDIMSSWPKSYRFLPSTAGTTASILIIKNGKFYTGHVGDSRIVISQENPETKQWISQQLTVDHKPESKAEIERIQRAGGEVRNKIGVHRVVWKRPLLNWFLESKTDYQEDPDHVKFVRKVNSYPIAESFVDSYQTIPFLAIARSLGDFWSINPYSGQYIVSPEPDVTCRPIQPNDSCILLATDGLWNVIDSPYAVRILQELNTLKNQENSHDQNEYFAVDNFYDVAGSSENHAQSLVYIAYQIWERKRLRSDNITVVVAMLHDILHSFQQTSKPYATRANSNSLKEIPKAKPTQIEETNNYLGNITLTRRPKFKVVLPEVLDEKKLQKHLILPPTLHCSELERPRNYLRLSSAICRRIIRRKFGIDSYIYIKQVSDDPADTKVMPTRVGKSGKEVRDASAQATQSMHDFGLPWDQLDDDENDEVGDYSKLEGYTEVFLEYDEKVSSKLYENGSKAFEVKSDAVEEDDEKLNEGNEGEGNDSQGDDNNDDELSVDSDEEKSMRKLRCLMNYSPPPRRTTRSSLQSVSENAKRKFQVDSSPAPKAKRRRSQPIQYSVK